MSARLKLEMFETAQAQSPTGAAMLVTNSDDLEESQLKAFEAGFKAGWDDATAAQDSDETALRSAVQRNLQDLAFTFHDARSHILTALAPLFSEITARLLPEVARASLPYVVSEALGPYADLIADAPVQVRVHPSSRSQVERIVGQSVGFPVRFVDDTNLTPGTVQLRLGAVETRVDLDAALAAITTAIEDFFTQASRETPNG